MKTNKGYSGPEMFYGAALAATAGVLAIGIYFFGTIIQPHYKNASDQLGVITVYITAATLLLVGIQIGLAFWQNVLARRELDIVDKQTTILEHQEAEMNRKAVLLAYYTRKNFDLINFGGSGMKVRIMNIGNRTARECRLALMLPSDFSIAPSGLDWHPRENGKDEREPGEVVRAVYEADISRLIFEKTQIELPWINIRGVRDATDKDEVKYRLDYADGSTPKLGFTVLPAAPRPLY